MLKKYKPDQVNTVIHSLLVGILLGGIAWFISCSFKTCNFAASIAVASLGFAFWNKFGDAKRIKSLEFQVSHSNKLVHREYAKERIGYLRNLLRKSVQTDIGVSYALSDVENILNAIYKCCSEGDEQRTAKLYKGDIGNFKTQIELNHVTNEIKEGIINKAQEIQEFLDEM